MAELPAVEVAPVVTDCPPGGGEEVFITNTAADPVPVTLESGDVEIGAVEIKAGTNDNRADVDLPANITSADLAVAVHDAGPVNGQSADGAVVSGLPVRVAGKDGSGNTQDIATDTAGNVQTVSQQTTGTATQSADITVDATATGVTVLAANAARKSAIIQNVGTANMRVNVNGSAVATTGLQLAPGQSLTLSQPNIPTTAVKAIREGAVSTTASVVEVA